MALSAYEKMTLDNAIKTIIDEMMSEERQGFTLNDIVISAMRSVGNIQMSNPAISCRASLGRIDRDFYRVDDTNNYLFAYNMIKLISNSYNFTKDRNKLYFECLPNTIYYDFQTKSFSEENFFDRLQKTKFAQRIFCKEFMDMLQYEWLFNYTSSFDQIIDIKRNCSKQSYQAMPKGLYAELQRENAELTARFLNIYLLKAKYGKFYKMAYMLKRYLSEGDLDTFMSIQSFDALLKIGNVTILNGTNYGFSQMCDLVDCLLRARELDNTVILDTNRDFDENIENLKAIRDREKNRVLAEKLQKLNFINGYTNNGYVVVVPQTQADKVNEGRMQNNCVGHYYDESILRGDNLIYFVRKATSPTRSYVTCRYNTHSNTTAEYRAKNNYDVSDESAVAFIKEVTDVIKRELGV